MQPRSPTGRVVIVPGAPGLLRRHASLVDPFAELRVACLEAVRWLLADPSDHSGPSGEVLVLADGGHEVAHELLAGSGPSLLCVGPDQLPAPAGRPLLVVADGSARRHDKGPGALDERAFDFDASLGAALRRGDLAALRALDLGLASELLAAGAPVLRALAHRLDDVVSAETTYDADPYGVQWWVTRWVAC